LNIQCFKDQTELFVDESEYLKVPAWTPQKSSASCGMISNKQCGFRELSEEKDFFDVTLACDDSQIQAHKVILSACSPFFLFPLLYLKGVKYKELLSVLNFMYIERLMWLRKNSIPLFLADRFTKESVVMTAPTKHKGGGELQPACQL
jgi:hypothetical protein